MFISVITGIAAGAIHIASGADHLVAMAPSALQNRKLSFRSAIAWGLGHSTGVLCLSFIAIIFKDWVNIQHMSFIAEFSVGIALLVVGVLAIKTSFRLDIHKHAHNHNDGHLHDHFHIHFLGNKKHNHHTHAVTGLGVLHGFAGTNHLLAVVPALALPPLEAVVYMAAYLLGSVLTMLIFLTAISLVSMKTGKNSLPLIFGFTGGLSVATGIFWLQKTYINFV